MSDFAVKDKSLTRTQRACPSAIVSFFYFRFYAESLIANRATVGTGLQHENELLQQKVTNLETLLQTERGITSELRRDKETTQKQLELVTLRLPAPKVGFWARLFGGGRKKEE